MPVSYTHLDVYKRQILDCWLVHEGDHAEIDGVAVRSVPLLMSDPKATAEMVSAGLELAGVATP